MSFLMLIPGIFELLEKIIGPIITGSGIPILKMLATSGGTTTGIVSGLQGLIGNIESTKLAELKIELDSMLANVEVDKVEGAEESSFKSCWRPFLAWGLSIITLVHLTIAEVSNVISLIHGGTLAPMDTLDGILLCGLLGIYIGARTIEKVNSNQDN